MSEPDAKNMNATPVTGDSAVREGCDAASNAQVLAGENAAEPDISQAPASSDTTSPASTPEKSDASIPDTHRGFRHKASDKRPRLWERLRAGFGRFPAATVLIVVAFVLSTLLCFELIPDKYELALGSAGNPSGIFARIIRHVHDLRDGCLLAVPVTLAAQLFCERRRRSASQSLHVQAVAGAVALAIFMLLRIAGPHLNLELLFELASLGVSTAALGLVPWLLMDRQNQDTLIPKLLSSVIYTGFLSGVLTIGLYIVVMAAEALILPSDYEIYRLAQEAAIIGFILVAPLLICAELPRLGEELRSSRIYRAMATYVVFPLCLLLLAVLYVYIARVVIAWSLPSGEMNWYGSFALLVFVGLWMGLREAQWAPARLFVRWGWLLLVPVVTVQLVGVWIRLQAYGLTPLRYASLLCTGIGIVALLMAAFGRSPRNLFVLMSVVALIGTVTPANLIDVPNVDQTLRLHNALERSGMLNEDGLERAAEAEALPSDSDQRAIASAWDYLRAADRGLLHDSMVDELRKRAETHSFERLFGFTRPIEHDREGNEIPSWRWYEFYSSEETVEVSGYSRIYDLDDAEQQYPTTDNDFMLKAQWNDGTTIAVDVSDLAEELVSRGAKIDTDDGYSSVNEAEPELLRIDCGDGRVLVIRRVGAGASSGEPSELSITAWLLVP